MRKYAFLVILLMLALIIGCSDQAVEEKPVPDVQAEPEPAAQQEITGAVAVQTEVEEPESSADPTKDCTLLTDKEINNMLGVTVLPDSEFIDHGSGKCERKWTTGDEEGSVVTLTVWIQTVSKTKGDLLRCYTFDSYEPIDDMGGHYACWYRSGKAVNFGKDGYKFQVSCSGEGCSQANMIKLAEMVVEKV